MSITGRAGRPIRFGIQTPQEGATYQDLMAHWIEADALGYHAIFLDDHMFPVAVPMGADQLDAFGVLPALAAATRRIRVGILVADNDYRHPALHARMIHAVDVITGGRAIFGVGAGWFSAEYEAYGIPFEAAKVRMAKLDEGIQIYKALSTEESPSFDGEHYRLAGARSQPKPVQKPWPPIMIGGGGEKLTLKIVAKHAHIWNFGGTPEEFEKKISIMESHCEAVGRDPSEIEATWFGQLVIDETDERVRDRLAKRAIQPLISGSPEQCIDRIGEFVDAGVTSFYALFGRVSNLASTQLFAETVMKEFS